MGLILTPAKGSEFEFIKDRVSAGKRSYYAIQGIGSKAVPLTPLVASKLYWNIAVPRMTYGLELLQLSQKCMDTLEAAHTSVSKQIQGLPKQTANLCIANLGWRSLETYIDIMKIMFVWRILLLKSDSIYKRVLISRLAYHLFNPGGIHIGPLRHILDVYNKYSLFENLYSSLVTGICQSIACFKNVTKQAVGDYERKCFIATMVLYKRLPHDVLYGIGTKMWFWWIYASKNPEQCNKCKVLARILYSETCLQSDVARFSEVHNKSCTWCPGPVVEDAAHMLFECERMADVRRTKWDEITDTMPDAMLDTFNVYDKHEKLRFILSGFNGAQYEDEWEPIYNCMISFVYKMYKARQLMDV